jgi:hypothetical protein
MSSAELVYGTPLTLPGEFLGTPEASAQEIADRIRSEVNSFNPLPVRQPLIADSSASVLEALQVATHVYVLRGGVIPTLAPRYQGPYLVLEKGPQSFRLAIGAREEVVSVDRLKPHTGDTLVTAAQPPRRGRPAADVKQSESQGLCALTPRTWAEIVRGGCGQPQKLQPLVYALGGWGGVVWRPWSINPCKVSGKSANCIVLKKHISLLLAAHVCLLICYTHMYHNISVPFVEGFGSTLCLVEKAVASWVEGSVSTLKLVDWGRTT